MTARSESREPSAALTQARAERWDSERGDIAEDHLREFRVKHALKIGLACSLCILVPALLHLQSIYLCPVFAFMLMSGFHSDTLAAGLEALGGVVVASLGALLITVSTGSAPPIYLALMLTWLFAIMLLLGRYPLGAILGGIIAAIILFTSIFVSRAIVWDLSVHFFSLVLVAVTISVAVDHLLWPPHRRTLFLDVLGSIYETLGTGFGRLPESDADDSAALRALLRLHELAHVIQSYHGGGPDRGHPPMQLVMHSSALILHLEFQKREWDSVGQAASDEDRALAARLLDGIGTQCRRLGEAALTRVPAPPIEPWLTEFATDTVEELPETRQAPDLERPAWVRSWSTPPALPMLARTIIRLGEATEAYNRVLALLGNQGFTARAMRPPIAIDSQALKRSAKTVLIVVLLILGQDWLDLPGQTMVAFYAIVFGVVANLGQAFTKTVEGLTGILAGLLFAMVCIAIVAALPSFTLFLGLMFLGVFGAGYLALQPGPLAFGALQAGLVLPFAALAYDGPEWTLADAETRALALVVAGCVSLLVHRLAWPVLPLHALRRSIAASLTDAGDKLGTLMRQANNLPCPPDPPDPSASARHLLPLSAVVPKILSLSNDARYLFSGMGDDSRRYHSVIQGLMSVHVHLSLLSGVIGRLEPSVRESFRTAAEPVVARLVDGCRLAAAKFEPLPSPLKPAEFQAGSATAALEPIGAQLWAHGPAGEEQWLFLSLLARSLDHLAGCLDQIAADADAINQTRTSAGMVS